MAHRRVAVTGFFLAALLFLVVALLPLRTGRGLNATFLALAVVFLVIGMGQARRGGGR